jgi:hypothetical protein
MAAAELAELLDQITPDSRRQGQPFSPDIEECHKEIFAPGKTRSEIEASLRGWLRTSPNQPCLFGRIAAGEGSISFCILTEGDVERGDAYVQEVVQRERRIWKAESLEGRKHAFIVALVSEALSKAAPDGTLQQIAERLCDLYLFDQNQDAKRHDVLHLMAADGRSFRWLVGVNVFAAQADGRWWRDHRIPGGLAFSMNSVGHMTFQKQQKKFPALGVQVGEALVNWALPTAMRTIYVASRGPQFGTCLMERSLAMLCPSVPEAFRKDVFRDIPEGHREQTLRDLSSFSEHLYEGWYDTDESIPASYFRPEIARPPGLTMLPLYFIYLHSFADFDYATMGIGEQLYTVDGESEPADAISKDLAND